MTIVGLFRRYQRWNPVHPTYGAFWGMGIGVGCGVGWGPGFGPDAVGFVGGGCGVGFSVGLTFIGFGIGLPAGGLPSLPYSALRFVSSEALNLTKTVVPIIAEAGNQRCKSFSRRVSEMENNLRRRVQNRNSEETLMGNGRWSSIELIIKEWEQKLKVHASQALRLINQKGPSDNSQ